MSLSKPIPPGLPVVYNQPESSNAALLFQSALTGRTGIKYSFWSGFDNENSNAHHHLDHFAVEHPCESGLSHRS